MSKKEKKQHKKSEQANDEKILNFEEAKDMTIGQVVRKQQDIKDGVEENDNILDRYIKQHREDIEAEKFDTIVGSPSVSKELEKELEEVVESQEEIESIESPQEDLNSDLQIHKVKSPEKVETAPVVPIGSEKDLESEFESDGQSDEENSTKKKVLIWVGLATIFVAALATAFIWMNNVNNSQTGNSSSTSQESTSSSADENVTAFEKLYASFFTDSSLTKLKNSEFDKLSQLKEALDKIGTSNAGYKAAKAKYDALEKAIKAIQDINGKFDKPAIVDGELDTTANVKANATFESTTTGLSAVDTLLTAAINMGRTQIPASEASGQGQAQADATTPAGAPSTPAATPAPATPVETPSTPVVSSNPGWVKIGDVIYGMEVPAGVTLQRELSRVPYNQAAIDDVNNESWNFNPGILEHIIAISQQRGYITGNQYILEKVNIINGRGYYNLFKPDGTYLFSINCKTGYFVGNGSGYSDALDY